MVALVEYRGGMELGGEPAIVNCGDFIATLEEYKRKQSELYQLRADLAAAQERVEKAERCNREMDDIARSLQRSLAAMTAERDAAMAHATEVQAAWTRMAEERDALAGEAGTLVEERDKAREEGEK